MSFINWIKNRRRYSRINENHMMVSAVPGDKVHNATERLTKGPGPLDHLLSVNGSVTPVDFVYGPEAGKIVTVSSLSGLLLDEGVMSATVFGSLAAALPNGVLILTKINGVERQLALLVDNACFALCFFGGNLGLGGGVGQDGFLDTNDVAASQRLLNYPITLNGDNGDQIIARVQDNLSTIDLFRIQANVTEIISK